MREMLLPTEAEIRQLSHDLYVRRGRIDGWAEADWFTADRAIRFHKNYERLCLVDFLNGKRTILGQGAPQLCRFCHRAAPLVTFKKDAHAVPAFLGNQTTLTNYECDVCNESFGVYLEDHFAKMLHGARSALRILGRCTVPNYKTRKKLSRVDIDNGDFRISQHQGDPIAAFDEEQRSVSFDFETQPFIPLAVYKCMTKIGLTLIPAEELVHFQETMNWVRNLDISASSDAVRKAAHVIRAFAPGPLPPRYGRVELFRRRHDSISVPYTALVITAMNLSFQLFLPACAKDLHLGWCFRFPLFPAGLEFDYEYGEPTFTMMNLSSIEKLNAKVQATMHSDVIQKTPSGGAP